MKTPTRCYGRKRPVHLVRLDQMSIRSGVTHVPPTRCKVTPRRWIKSGLKFIKNFQNIAFDLVCVGVDSNIQE